MSHKHSHTVCGNKKFFPDASRLKVEGAGLQKQKNTKTTKHSAEHSVFPHSTTRGKQRPTCGETSRPESVRPRMRNDTRQCCTAGTGPQRSSVSDRASLPPNFEVKELESMHSVRMGIENTGQRLQASIRHNAPPFQRSHRFPCAGRVGPGVTGRNISSIKQTCHTNSATPAEAGGFLFEVFPGPKERGDLLTSHSGPSHFKLVSQEIQVSHANTHNADTFDPAGGLVHIDRSERRIFSHSHLSSAQEISEVRFSGHSVRVPSTPIWPVTEPEGVCEMCRRRYSPPQGAGYTRGHLSGRLAAAGALRARGCGAHGHCADTPGRSGVCGEQGKERVNTETGNCFSGSHVKFTDLHGSPVSRESVHFQVHSLSFCHNTSGHVRTVPQVTGTDGLNNIGSEAGQAVHEGFPALGSFSQTGSCAPQTPQCNGLRVLRPRAATMATAVFLDSGGAHGRNICQKSGDNGRQPVRLGRCVRGQIREWDVEHRSSTCPYKLSGVDGSVSDAETFSAVPPGTSCVSEDRQYDHGGVYQSSGGSTFSTVTHSCTQTDIMGRGASPLRESDPRSRESESGCGPFVQGKSSLRGVDTSPGCCRSDLVTFRPRNSRSVRVEGERTVPTVLLPARPERTARGGCVRSRVAARPALRFSTSGFDSPDTAQGAGESSVTDFDRPSLAVHALAGGSETAPPRSPMASPAAQGPALPGARTDISPSSGAPRPVGLAREWFNLSLTGLSQSVVNTIQNARASSTRSLYDCKWRVFEDWCAKAHEIPFQCPVGTILSFLQDLIDQMKAFSTVKVYLAAISACHVGFDGKPAGQHPLVCRFMKGARRLLPITKTMSPSWDLAVVLEALSSHPFEPLDNVDMKTLSLKVALLMALATAKRVSEIHALSVHPACMRFTAGNLGVTLRPNPAFVPKVVKPCSPVELSAFQPPPYGSAEQQRLHMLCPVRALHTYVERTRSFRKGDQLFVSWAKPHWGKPITKQRLSHWIVDAIALAYSSSGLQVPTGLRAHSTRGLATSWALFKGVSIQDICAAASWSSPLTFARFYRLDVTSPGLTHAVLSVGSSVDLTSKWMGDWRSVV